MRSVNARRHSDHPSSSTASDTESRSVPYARVVPCPVRRSRRRSRRALLTSTLLLASVTASTGARGDAPPAPEIALTPARVEAAAEAAYPEGATGRHDVLVQLVVETDGSTAEIVVLDGPEPFASAARAAAARYRFTPARRGEVAVRSRVRVLFTFTPPPPPPRATATPRAEPEDHAATTARAPSGARVVEDVTVTGVRSRTSTPTEHRLGRADVRLIPGAFGDAYRAIEILPGVVPTVSGLPFYYVRGAPPSAVGYFVDEVRVPYVFHFGLGPSVLQQALLDEVTLHPAAFPGRYGRYAGAIVAGTTRAPASELRGEGQLRLFDAGAWVESPLANGRATVGAGGRYSYTAALFSLVSPTTTLSYRDYNARASYELGAGWTASVFSFGAYDLASERRTFEDGVERDVVFFASEFYRADLRLDRRGRDGSLTRIAATLGYDRTRLEGARFATDALAGARARHGARLTPEVDVEIGADVSLDRYAGDLPSPFAVTVSQYESALAFFSPRVDTATGAWLTAAWHPRARMELTATARADVFTSAGAVGVGPSPRASLRAPLTDRASLVGALGVGAQPPAFAIPIPAVGYRRLPGGLGYGYQKSGGVEVDLPAKIVAKVGGFHHSYFNLRDISRNSGDLDFEEPQPVPSSPTQAYGLELFVSRKLTDRVGGFLSYTLSRSVVGSDGDAVERLSPFDRTHVLHVGGMVDLGRMWRASLRFLAYRGWPDLGESAANQQPRGRLPTFVRLDARVEKRWRVGPTGSITMFVEALNTTASKEILRRRCSGELCQDEAIGPIVVPSLGVEGAL